jgi:hypothetical protein
MATTIPKPRRTRRRSLAFVAPVATLAFIAAACGSSEPSADEARQLLMQQLADGGVATDDATCIVDEALERFEPGELVNTSGEATAEVDAALRAIVMECSTPLPRVPETSVPQTTVPQTAVLRTTVPDAPDSATTVPETTTPPEMDLTAFCSASEDVLIGLMAGDAFDAPSPATMEAFFAELIDRIELAIVTAPNSEFAEQPNELLTAIQGYDAALAASGYDVELVSEEELADEGEVVDTVTAELEGFLADCDTGTDVEAEANALAQELTELGLEDVPPPVDGDTRTAEDVEGGISSDVPASWTSELSETVDDRHIFIVAVDADGFTTSWSVDGVRFTHLDTTADYVPLMDESDAARECTLLVEEDFENSRHTGKLRRYENCGDDTEAVVIGVNETDGDGTTLVELQMVDFDPVVLALITDSFG